VWAVSGRRPTPMQRGRRPRPVGLLASPSPPADRPRVPFLRHACHLQPAHLVAWRPFAAAAGTAGSLGHETRQSSRRRWPSGLSSPLSPPAGRPRVSPAYIAVPDYRPAHVRRKTSHPRTLFLLLKPPYAAREVRRGGAGRQTASWRRHVRRQDAYTVFPATSMRWGRAPPDCGDAHTECCVRVWCWVERLLNHDWVCMCRWAGSCGSGGAGENGLRVGGRGPLRLIQCVSRVFRNDFVHIPRRFAPSWTQTAGMPPPRVLCML